MDEYEELDSMISLTDADGNEETFEILDIIDLDDASYLILLPENDEDGEVLILQELNDNEDVSEFGAIEDDDLAQKIFDLFKERNPELCE